MTAGQVGRDVRAAAKAAGGHVGQVEYELSTSGPLGEPPADDPAWLWCTLTDRGRDFIADIEATVGGDPTWERVDGGLDARCFIVTSNLGAAELVVPGARREHLSLIARERIVENRWQGRRPHTGGLVPLVL